MNITLKGDRYIWACSIILILTGCLVFYSTAPSLLGKVQYSTLEITMLFIKRHLVFVIIGLVAMYLIHKYDYTNYNNPARILLFFFTFLLILTNFIGIDEGQAMRKLKIFGVSFQPAEFAKIFLIIDLAAILANFVKLKKDEFKFKKLYEMIAICGIIIFLVTKNSNSAGIILAATCYIMMFIGGIPKRFLLYAPLAFFAIAIPVAAFTEKMRTEVLVQRIEAFVDSDWNKDGIIGSPEVQDSIQQDLAIMAVSTTNFPFGKQAGKSEIKNTLPLSYSDFAFSVLVEEYGAFGSFFIVFIYLFLLYRGVVNIQHTKKAYGGYLSIGLTLTIVFQALIHIFVNIGLAPVTGQTLPLISQGGSSIIAVSMALGLILSVSRTDFKETT